MARRKRPTRAAPQRSLPVRIARMHNKLIAGVGAGLLAYALTSGGWPLAPRLLVAWDIGVAVYLLLTHAMMWRAKAAYIRQRAAEQDEGGLFLLLLSVAATIVSLAAVVALLGGSKETGGALAVVYALFAMATILLSWFFMHTIFSLHYAHEYYGERGDGTIGGLDFPGKDDPDYWDFFYFSMVIGMTSQVSDVAVTSRFIRRMVAAHGVLSFFFNVAVLALTVNTVSNLI